MYIKHSDDIHHKLKSKCFLAYEPVYEISNNVVYATSKASDHPAHTRSLIRAFASRLSVLKGVKKVRSALHHSISNHLKRKRC